MTVSSLVVGLLLGVFGGLAHLAITRMRVAMALQYGAWTAVLGYPLGLAAPALAVLAAAKVAMTAAWIVPVGLLVGRFFVLGAAARRPS